MSKVTEVLLNKIFIKLDQLKDFVFESNQFDNSLKRDLELSLEEKTTAGSTDTENVQAIEIILDGNGGSIDGVTLPSGTSAKLSNDTGGTVKSINYTIPTDGNTRVVLIYSKYV